MFRKLLLLFTLFAAACSDSPPETAASAAAPPPAPVKTALCEIDGNSIGGIPLGITPAQIRQQFPNAVITPVRDAEGVDFLSVKLNPEVQVFAYYDETAAVPVDERPLNYLDTPSKACQTEHGVHPEMPLAQAEQRYGAVRQIVMSETDNRQTAEFDGQPATLSFRIDDAGAFDENDTDLPKIATEYREGAKIQSIAVFGLPDGE